MVRIRTLGECSIEVGPQASRLGPESTVLFAALLYLGVERGRRIARRTMVELLWPGVPEDRARHCLRQTLYRLRRLGAPLLIGADGVELPAAEVAADYDQLTDGTAGAGALGATGEFLPSYAPSFSAAFGEWVDEQRSLVSSRLRRALLSAMLERRARGDWLGVELFARKCLQVDPLNEEATLGLAEATALAGGKSEALRILDSYRAEVGPAVKEIGLPARVLRQRIAEHIQSSAPNSQDACFVGRAEVMAAITAKLQEALSGRGNGIHLWGAAGLGKTRLLNEFFKAASLRGTKCLCVACQPSDHRRPLSVFVDLVPLLLSLPGSLGADPTSLSYLHRLTDHHEEAASPSPDAQDAEVLSFKIRHALLDLIDALAAENALLIAIEDVHWLDETSWLLLRQLLEGIGTKRLLLILTSRSTPAECTPIGVRITPQKLDPLQDSSAEALVRHIASQRIQDAPTEILSWCVRLGDGNPLHLGALINHWLDTGTTTSVPASLSQLVSQRLARLHTSSLRVLQCCAVLGKNATFSRLEALAGSTSINLLDAIEDLTTSGLVVFADGCLRPKHSLIADHAISVLSEPGRRLLHRQAGAIFEGEINADHSAALLWDCAEHWLEAGDERRAVSLARACAKHLVEVGLPDEAAEVLNRAVTLCKNNKHALDVMEDLRDTCQLTARSELLIGIIKDIQRLRDSLSIKVDPHNEEELALLEAHRHELANIPTLLDRALTCVNASAAAPIHRVRAAALALAYADVLYEQATATHVQAIAMQLHQSQGVSAGAILHAELIYHSSYGDLDSAVRTAHDLVQFEEVHGNVRTLLRAQRHASVPLRRAGMFDEATALLCEALRLAESYSLAKPAFSAASYLVSTSLERGDFDAGEMWYQRAQSLAVAQADGERIGEFAMDGSLLALLRADLQQARARFPFTFQNVASQSFLRLRSEQLALLILLQLASRAGPVPRPWIVELERLHLKGRAFGDNDIQAQALFAALVNQGLTNRAVDLWRDYVTLYRRERGPMVLRGGSALEACKPQLALALCDSDANNGPQQ